MTRDAMVFPFRWFDSLLELEADLPVMLAAIRQYAENGEEPNFKGAMAGLWREIKDRIDADAGKYAERCERNRDNAKKRWKESDAIACHSMPSHANACERMRTDAKGCEPMPTDAKNADGEGDGEGDLKKKPPIGGKEKTTTTEKETFITSYQKQADFSKWSEADFRASVAAAVKDHPEYKPCVEDFTRYWLEPDRRGKFRFALEKTWAIGGRLATWHQRQIQRAGPQQNTTGGYRRDPKTGIVTGTGDEESYAEWKRNGGF